MTQQTIITLARDCYAGMAPEAEIGSAMLRYRRTHNVPRSMAHLFESVVRNIDCRGDHHSDARLLAWATGDPRADEVKFW